MKFAIFLKSSLFFKEFAKLGASCAHVRYVPRCFTCLLDLRLYVLLCHVPTCLFFVTMCLRAINYFAPTCADFQALTCLKPLISALCNKASNQVNIIGRIQKCVGFKEKEVLLNSFVYSNFNYCPLVWHFCSSKFLYKIEKIQEWLLR